MKVGDKFSSYENFNCVLGDHIEIREDNPLTEEYLLGINGQLIPITRLSQSDQNKNVTYLTTDNENENNIKDGNKTGIISTLKDINMSTEDNSANQIHVGGLNTIIEVEQPNSETGEKRFEKKQKFKLRHIKMPGKVRKRGLPKGLGNTVMGLNRKRTKKPFIDNNNC